MKNSLEYFIEYGIINIPTDCVFCFGTGKMYPNELGVLSCIDEDCEAGQKRESFYGGYGSHRQVLCRTGVVWNVRHLEGEDFEEDVCDGINYLEDFARVAWVDVELYQIISELWNQGIDTFSSCQGEIYEYKGEKQSAYVSLCLVDDKKIDLARDIISKYGIITSEEDYRNNDDHEGPSDYVFRWLWKISKPINSDKSSVWDNAFEEVKRARDTNTHPNPEVFEDLTKSTGGN